MIYLEVIYDLMQSRLWYLLTLLTLVSRKIQLTLCTYLLLQTSPKSVYTCMTSMKFFCYDVMKSGRYSE